jgi:uncharacterized protein YciI
MRIASLFLRVAVLSLAACASAQTPAAKPAESKPATYDAELAKSLGADDYGMRSYVFVLLKTGPTPVPDGEARDAMFKGHLANIRRLADAGKLAYAGPLDGVDGWRGIFVFAVDDIGEAKKLVATDPAIQAGELVAEYHKHYGSAALMLVDGQHERIAKQAF